MHESNESIGLLREIRDEVKAQTNLMNRRNLEFTLSMEASKAEARVANEESLRNQRVLIAQQKRSLFVMFVLSILFGLAMGATLAFIATGAK